MTLGELILVASYFISIVAGFQARFLWGVFLLFVPPFGQFFFALKHWQQARTFVLVAAAGFVVMVLEAGLGSAIDLLVIIAGVIVLGYWFIARRRSKSQVSYRSAKQRVLPAISSNSSTNAPVQQTASREIVPYSSNEDQALQLKGGFLGSKPVTTEGITYNKATFNALLAELTPLLIAIPGSTREKSVRKVFENPAILSEFLRFEAQRQTELDISNGTASRYLTSEAHALFCELMHRNARLDPRTTTSILFYVHDDRRYAEYKQQYDGFPPADFGALVDKTVLDDITFDALVDKIVLDDITYARTPNFRHVRRMLREKGISSGNLRNIERHYESHQNELRLEVFARNLATPGGMSSSTIDDQIRRDQHRAEITARVSEFIDLSPTSYYIAPTDYSRDSRIDNYYRLHFSRSLSRAFDGHCCKCGEGMQQLEYDHFWLPKSSGGNFLMRSVTRVYVNNCIPLCRSCNSSKGNKDYRDFFDEDELIEVIKRSQSLSQYLNENMLDFNDPDFPDRAY